MTAVEDLRGSHAARGLACRECGAERPLEALNACAECFGPLEVVYDLPQLARTMTWASVAAGPASIWRYRQMLPDLPGAADRVDLGAGFTPLVPAPRLGAALGLDDLWLKNDTRQPHLVVQGPGRVGGPDARAACWLQTPPARAPATWPRPSRRTPRRPACRPM